MTIEDTVLDTLGPIVAEPIAVVEEDREDEEGSGVGRYYTVWDRADSAFLSHLGFMTYENWCRRILEERNSNPNLRPVSMERRTVVPKPDKKQPDRVEPPYEEIALAYA